MKLTPRQAQNLHDPLMAARQAFWILAEYTNDDMNYVQHRARGSFGIMDTDSFQRDGIAYRTNPRLMQEEVHHDTFVMVLEKMQIRFLKGNMEKVNKLLDKLVSKGSITYP